MIGIVNAHMFGAASEIGERVDWSSPDVDTQEGWTSLLGCSIEDYAERNPHMIVFVVKALAPAIHRLGFAPPDGLGQVRCHGCGCNFPRTDTSHVPGSAQCSDDAIERDASCLI